MIHDPLPHAYDYPKPTVFAAPIDHPSPWRRAIAITITALVPILLLGGVLALGVLMQ